MTAEEHRQFSEAASLDVTRIVTLVGTNIAIFTFLLFFLYLRYLTGEIDSFLFQATLTLLGFAVFSLVFAVLFYYALTLPNYLSIEDKSSFRKKRDLFWVLGFMLFLLEPTLILFTIQLVYPAIVWFVLWIAYV